LISNLIGMINSDLTPPMHFSILSALMLWAGCRLHRVKCEVDRHVPEYVTL